MNVWGRSIVENKLNVVWCLMTVYVWSETYDKILAAEMH